MRPIYLTTHAIESHHKMTKKDYTLSLKSTKRRHGRSGLIDVLNHDNIYLKLIFYGIYPWERLFVPISLNCNIKRGKLIKKLKELFPKYDFVNNEIENNILDVDNNNEISSDSHSEVEDEDEYVNSEYDN